MQEEKAPKPLEEAAAIAKALEPLGYEVYGIEDTWYAGQIPGLVVKVIRTPGVTGKYNKAFWGRRVKN